MVYRSERTKDDSSGIPDAEMFEPWREAQQVLNRYESAVTDAVAAGRDPRSDPDVQRHLSLLHTAVMSSFRRMAPYLRGTRYWDEEPLLEEHGLMGLQELDTRQLGWSEQQREVETRHGGVQYETVRQMNYLPARAYERALQLIGERLRQCGFAPQAMIQDFDDPEVLE